MRTFKRFLLLQIGPSPWEFLLALLTLVWGVVGGLGSLNPACQTLGMVSPIVALCLALDAVRVWHLLSMPGKVVSSLFILLLGTMAWDTLAEAAQALFPAGR